MRHYYPENLKKFMNNITFIFILVLSVGFTASCSSRKKLLDEHIVNGSCDEKFKAVELESGQSLWANIQEASGNSASYMITGLGYSTDVIVTFAGGVVGTVTVCSPLLLADSLAKANGSLAQGCVESVSPQIFKKINPKLGDKAFATTANWRCPNVDSIGQALVEVAKCYQEKGEISKSKEQVEEIRSSYVFNLCLSPKMKEEISHFEISLK
jgi:hypothetical protein